MLIKLFVENDMVRSNIFCILQVKTIFKIKHKTWWQKYKNTPLQKKVKAVGPDHSFPPYFFILLFFKLFYFRFTVIHRFPFIYNVYKKYWLFRIEVRLSCTFYVEIPITLLSIKLRLTVVIDILLPIWSHTFMGKINSQQNSIGYSPSPILKWKIQMLPLFVTKTSVVAGHQKHYFVNFNVINNNNKQQPNNKQHRSSN